MRRTASEILSDLEIRIANLEKQATRYDGDLYCPDCFHTPLEVLGKGYYSCDKCGHQPHISELDTSVKKASKTPPFGLNRESVLRFFDAKIAPVISKSFDDFFIRNLVSIEVSNGGELLKVSFNHQEFSFSHEFPEQMAFTYLFRVDSNGVVSSTRKSGKGIDLNDYLRHWDLYNHRRKGDHVKVSINP